jgi:tetratricopeptide (TPR) repeat protein
MGGYASIASGNGVSRRPAFVGRTREFEELRSALSAGFGSLMLVSGEPGIGKSRLLQEVAGYATDQGWQVLPGRCWDGGGAPAYWPWMQVVRAAGEEFERLGSASTEPVAPDAARFQLFDRVGRFLADAARRKPCLVLLDDLHAADEPSLLLLRFLAATPSDDPLVIIGSYRERESRVREMEELFADLARLARRVRLRGLSTEEVVTFIGLVAQEEPPESVIAHVNDVTGGNPFFIGEIVRALVAEGRLDQVDRAAAVRLPEEVRALIRRRVAGLSTEAVSTLRVAAVIGRGFDLRTLASTSTLSSERLVDVLAEAVAAGVVAEDADSPGVYAFAHDLVRETLYEDLPAGRRIELHRNVGEVLEELFRDDREPHLAELAHHFVQAAPLGDADRAVEYSVRAGDRAASLFAYEDAARQYSRALQLLPPTEATQEHADILLRLGDVQSRAGDAEDSRESFERAAAIARRGRLPDTLARAALGYGSMALPARLGFGGILLTARFESAATGIALLEEALGLLPEGDGVLRARVLARLATELYVTEYRDRRLQLSQDAIDMALRLGDPGALVQALHGRHWATLAPETVQERLTNAQQMLLTATGAGDEEAAFLARHARLHCFLELCDVAGLDAELERLSELADRIRQPFYLWHAETLRGMRALLDGRLGAAERRFRDALEITRHRGDATVGYMFEYAQLVALRWVQGRMQEVEGPIREHGDRFRGIARWRDALVAAELGQDGEARAEVERFARGGFAELPRDGLWILHMCGLAQACVLIRDEQRASQAYEQLRPFADRNAISVSTLPFGPVAMRLGMLATLLERWEEAERSFNLALERCDTMGARGIEARVLVEYGAMLRARGRGSDPERADTLLERATTLCRELDLPGIAERAAALARPAGRTGVPIDERATFRREGQFWTIAYGEEMARLRDVKGLRYIAALLAMPGRDVHVLELAAQARGEAGAHAQEGDLHGSRSDQSEPVLDARAKDEYRRRLTELKEDLEEARSWNDPERVAKLEEEFDVLTEELERALGLGGRDRLMPSSAERTRVSVTKAIKGAVRTISIECPGLGEHLSASIHTGRFCSYAPPAREPPVWVL